MCRLCLLNFARTKTIETLFKLVGLLLPQLTFLLRGSVRVNVQSCLRALGLHANKVNSLTNFFGDEENFKLCAMTSVCLKHGVEHLKR